MRNACLLIPFLILVGCGGGGGEDNRCHAVAGGLAAPCDQPAHLEPRDCTGELVPYCETGACGGYDDTLAALAGSCSGNPPRHSVVRVGTCGSLRFIEVLGSGIGQKTLRFYDGGGKMIAAQVASDTNSYCDGTSFSRSYGPVPCCSMQTTEVTCSEHSIIC